MVRLAEKIAKEARDSCEKWRQNWQRNVNNYHEMTEFVKGRQWQEEEEDVFKTNKKIPLQFNKVATIVNTLLGEQQQNTPQLQVVPMENCDQETAKLRELIIKDIMLSTNAKTVYQVAAEQSFVGGFGAFIIATEYINNKSFDLDIVYRYVKDPTRCYWDVSAETINKTDGMYAGYLTRMSRQKFRQVYGKDIEKKILYDQGVSQTEQEISLVTDPKSLSNVFAWADAEAVTIQDHFVRKSVKDVLYKMSNGRVYNQSELDELIERSRKMNAELQSSQMFNMGEEAGIEMAEGMPLAAEQTFEVAENEEEIAENIEEDVERMTLWDHGEPVRIEDKREIQKYKIKHQKICGDYLLEESDFPSQQLPIVFVDQNSYYDKDGKQICRPFVIDAKDTQRYINYLGTQSAYTLKVSRYDQFICSKENLKSNDTQQIWRDPSVVQGALFYDESPQGNKPEQLHPPELSNSLVTQYQRAMEDLYTSTGIYPARMGMEGNEVSGKAINARTRQGSYSTYVAFNSINRAIAVGGEIVNEMIPIVYDTERVLSLMTPDKGQQNITINKAADEYGERIENDIRKGSFQVRLQPGPSYEGQKEEALMSLQSVIQAAPQIFPLFADLYAENLPLANTIELKNRLKTIVPPNVIEAGKTGKMPYEEQNKGPNPEQQMMQMQQQQMQMDMMIKQKTIELKQQELAMKAQQMQLEAQQAMQKLETERLEVAAQLEEQKLRYLAETDRTQSDAAISHANNLTSILTHKM